MSLALALAALVAVAGPATAADRTAACKIIVKGRTYLDGPCLFSPTPDGSFSIGTGETAKSRSKHFAYVNKNGANDADAYWNEDPSDTHAQDPLGTVHRSGACWVNATAQICAR